MKLPFPAQSAKTVAFRALGLLALVPAVAFGEQPTVSAHEAASGPSVAEGLDSKLAMRAPKGVPAEIGNPSVAKGLGLAFNNDDWKALYAAKGFGSCQTSSIGASPFAKNFSNFGADCFKALSDRFYLTNDVRLRKDGKTLGRPTYGWNAANVSDVVSPAGTRFASRAATAAAGSNPVLRSLVEGRVDVSFSLGRLLGVEESRIVKADPRPRYVLKVTESRLAEPETVRVAALDGTFGLGYVDNTRSAAFEVGERSLVEEWESPAANALQTSESANTKPAAGMLLARRVGVAHIPFLKYGVRFERRVSPQGDAIAARFAEANDIVYAELSNVMGQGVLAYGYRLPYHRHSVTVAYVETSPRAVTTYGFSVNDANKAWASYNANTEAYAAGFVRQL
ncbi:MAG: hypothetical protein IOD12_02545 [Silvanigrellales bacterium]|nr:hypothetical protein [Silvanigrellales bacterium]